MTLLRLLMHQFRNGHVANNFPLAHALTTPKNIERLRGIPFFLFSGSDNKVLSPESTEITYCKLRDTFGCDGGEESGRGRREGFYERVVVEGYGHLDCWMGKNSFVDVYPMVRLRVDRICRGVGYVYRE
jgi:hypothetical protein